MCKIFIPAVQLSGIDSKAYSLRSEMSRPWGVLSIVALLKLAKLPNKGSVGCAEQFQPDHSYADSIREV